MSRFVDLHVHSTASDGSYSPEELVEMACEIGLYAFAITDHDTIDGIPKALRHASRLPVKVIPGVELSCSYKGSEVHILAYNFNMQDTLLKDALKQVSALRQQRSEKMCGLLRKQGFDITIDGLYNYFGSNTLTRASFALYMLAKGYVADKEEAYEKYLGERCSCYVPRFKLSLEDAALLIKHSGAYGSVAHPVKYKMTDEEYMKLFLRSLQLGIGGIEAIYSTNTEKDEEKFCKMAADLGMYITGGTDYHGFLKPDINLGTGRGNLMIPDSLLKNIGCS